MRLKESYGATIGFRDSCSGLMFQGLGHGHQQAKALLRTTADELFFPDLFSSVLGA